MGNEQIVQSSKLSRSSSNSSFVLKNDDSINSGKINGYMSKIDRLLNLNQMNCTSNKSGNQQASRNNSTKEQVSKSFKSFECLAEVYKHDKMTNSMKLYDPNRLRLLFSTYCTNNPHTIYFTLNMFKINFEKLTQCTLVYPGTKIYFESRVKCRFTDLNDDSWSIKFQNANEADLFQSNIRVTIKDCYAAQNRSLLRTTKSTRISSTKRLSLSILADFKNRKYKYLFNEDKSEFYLNSSCASNSTTTTRLIDDHTKNQSLMSKTKENVSPKFIPCKSEISIHKSSKDDQLQKSPTITTHSGLLIPRSYSEMNIIKTSSNESTPSNKTQSKTPSLNSILDGTSEEKKLLNGQLSESDSYECRTTNFRGSEYTDSGIGYGSLIDTNSHRSSLLSQISCDSSTNHNQPQSNESQQHINYLNANLIQDLNNRTNAKWLKKQKQKTKEMSSRKMITSLGGILNLDEFSSHGALVYPKPLDTQEKDTCVFTDLNLLISDDDLLNNSNNSGESGAHLTSNMGEAALASNFDNHPNKDSFQSCTRKAGWLHFKNWLVNTRGKLELASKRSWKKYWVTSKKNTLYFYADSSEIDENSKPKHTLNFENCVVQSLPEYPRKENIFCLSTSFGQVFLFQTSTQNELDNWIRIINNACAYAFTHTTSKKQVLHALSVECESIEKSIDKETKMKKMAELQLNITQDTKSREAILKQIQQWDKNLEKLNVNLYKCKCYYSSVNSIEIPNPKSLLAQASKTSKTLLTKLGAFAACTLHALNATQTKPKITQSNLDLLSLSLTKSNNNELHTLCTARSVLNNDFSKQRNSRFGSSMRVTSLKKDFVFDNSMQPLTNPTTNAHTNHIVNILLPNKEHLKIDTKDYVFVKQLLDAICLKMRYESKDYFLINIDNRSTKVDLNERINDQLYNNFELHKKQLYSIEFLALPHEQLGLSIEVELDDTYDDERDDRVRVFVSSVREKSEANRRGVLAGDEILIINGQLVENFNLNQIDSLMCETKELRLTLKTSRTHFEMNLYNLSISYSSPLRSIIPHATSQNVPKSADQLAQTEAIINQMICPPPPPSSCVSYKLNLKTIDSLIVPSPSEFLNDDLNESIRSETKLKRQNAKLHLNEFDTAVDSINNLLKDVEHVTNICRSNEIEFADDVTRVRPLTNAQKLRKVIFELIDTEKNYVKDLECMIERYLEPLKQESFLSQDDIDSLFGNILEILEFQKKFLSSLEQSVDVDVLTFNTIAQFRNALFSISASFLDFSNQFKLYGSFCANHSKAQKQLQPESNPKLEQFLAARNPKQQHSCSLESYLIKPIQRILKYPLLLKQLLNYSDQTSEEFEYLSDALKCMQSVAEQINDMQKIFEEYGSYFDTVMKKHKSDRLLHKIDLSPNHLLLYGQVEWLNISDGIDKLNKKYSYETLCFVFDSGTLLLCIESKPKLANKKSQKFKPQNACFLTFIPIAELQVRNSEKTSDEMHTWDLIHMHTSIGGSPSKIYTLGNRCEDTKTIFIKRIRSLIQESLKNVTTIVSPSPQIKVMARQSNRDKSNFNLNRYSYISDHSDAIAAKYSPSSWSTSNSQPDSPIWRPRNHADNSSETTTTTSTSDTNESKRKHRYIQYKAPKSTQYFDDNDMLSNDKNYILMSTNNESTEC